MDLATRMRNLFIEALDLPADADVANLHFREHPQWDSLGHMSLVVAIEDEFGLEMDTEQLIAMNSFAKAMETVQGADAGTDGG